MSDKRSWHAEKKLLEEIHAVLLNKKPPSDEWEKSYCDDPQRAVGAVGSNNWAQMAQPVRYARGFTKRGIDIRQELINLDEAHKVRWGGRELDSTIYESFVGHAHFVISKIAAQRGDNEILQRYRAINRYRAARFALMWSAINNSVFGVGQRSAGHRPDGKSWLDNLYRVGMGRMQPKASWHDPAYRPYASLFHCREEILLAFKDIREGIRTPLQILEQEKRQSMVPVFYMETDHGCRAAWQPYSIHSATQAVLGFVEVNLVNACFWAPRNAGADKGRLSRRPNRSECKLVVGTPDNEQTLQYISHGIYDPVNLIIYGEPTVFVSIGGDLGFQNLLQKDPPVIIVPPVKPPRDDRDLLEKFVDWIRSINPF